MDIIQQLVKLVKINTRISSLDSSADILREIMHGAMDLSGTISAFVLRVGVDRKITLIGEYYLRDDLRVSWSSTSAYEAHDGQRLVYSTNAKETSTQPSIVKGDIQTLISTPMASEPQGTLLLQLVGQDAAALDPQMLTLLALFVSQAQVTISKTRLEEAAIKSAELAAVGELAAQVGHDIRSPLAALEVVSGDVAQLPEDKRILIRSAVGRIRDIANSLVNKNRAAGAAAKASSDNEPSLAAIEAVSPELLSSLIETLVTEKRLQFRAHFRVKIESWLDAPSYGIFSRVQPIEFKRLLSNLINNAVEAFGDGPGSVRINLSAKDGRARISVKDDGKGIQPEILAKLGQRGETHGKVGGSGLGLHHARISAESWGGRLEISSSGGKGATVTVDLPQASTPDWFVSELTLLPDRAIVVLDDDASIHKVWQGRLEALQAREHGVEIVHVSTPVEIRSWIEENERKASEALYLLDYELGGYDETGLSLAEELEIGERAILVTSHYEEAGVLEGCRKLKARMIPKGLAGLVPIRVENKILAAVPSRKRWDAVLIDDDPLVCMTWKIAAEKAGKKLQAFPTAADFLKEADTIDRETPVYMDAELGKGVKGDVESLKIHELGFGEIYLATGHEPEKFAGLAYLRGVLGKAPPWGGA